MFKKKKKEREKIIWSFCRYSVALSDYVMMYVSVTVFKSEKIATLQDQYLI